MPYQKNTFNSKLVHFKISSPSSPTSVNVKKCMGCWFDEATFQDTNTDKLKKLL